MSEYCGIMKEAYNPVIPIKVKLSGENNMKQERREFSHRIYKNEPNARLGQILGGKFVKYRGAWDKALTGNEIPNFPLDMSIDIIDNCNLSCTFCYRHHGMSSKNKMSYKLFKKIIDECSCHSLPAVTFGFGEPLMHPDIVRMVEYANISGVLDTIISTNGVLLTQAMSKSLIRNNLRKLHVSIDATTKETYKKVRGYDLDKIEHNIHNFIKIRNEHGTQLPLLRVSFIHLAENKHELDLFIKKWVDVADYIDIQEYFSTQNVDKLSNIKVEKFDCPNVNRGLNITVNGDIRACCSFYSKHLKLGNIDTTSICNIWHSKEVEAIRNSFKTKDYYLACRNCYGEKV